MIARVLLGLSAGVFTPTANAVAVQMVPPEMRGPRRRHRDRRHDRCGRHRRAAWHPHRRRHVLARAVRGGRRGQPRCFPRPPVRPAAQPAGHGGVAPPAPCRRRRAARPSGAAGHAVLGVVDVRRVHLHCTVPQPAGHHRLGSERRLLPVRHSRPRLATHTAASWSTASGRCARWPPRCRPWSWPSPASALPRRSSPGRWRSSCCWR